MKEPNFSELKYLRVAAASPEVAIGDPMSNANSILSNCQALSNQQVAVAVFPELCLSGYSAEDLFFTETLIQDSRRALALLCELSSLPLIAVGAPWRLRDGRLLNCAVVIGGGRILGMVPKSVQPNYGEFYDLRWFSPGAQINESEITDDLGRFQIRVDQLFEFDRQLIGVEICEDLWAPLTPGTHAALAGAQLILNLSASNELISKADYRRDLVRMTSAKNLCGYVYAAAGATESTKDVVFGGHCMIAEAGQIIAEGERFSLTSQTLVSEIDCQKLAHDRAQNTTFGNAERPRAYRIIDSGKAVQPLYSLTRTYPAQPFVPADEGEFNARASEILNIQSTGLARRMLAARSENLVIGLSGGLDSTLAFLVAKDALAKLNLPGANLHAITLPGPGTTAGTLDNAHGLAAATQGSLQEIPIAEAVRQHLQDLDHQGDHDVVFENAQARERTQILFNMANKVGGIVVGTGDLSELALGWCTFNADHMANYNVNASIPKTMMAYLLRWYGKHRANEALAGVLDNVLATPISPELIPPKDGEISQITEALVGPYELHDFFLYHFLRNGAPPSKIFHLAVTSFEKQYDTQTIQKWLGQFFSRFMSQQFKRTTLPPGPKVGSVSLSPRGDWRMPDEASAEHILKEIDALL
jgi:NAD+ synthase (glutamine-hydrolysing)